MITINGTPINSFTFSGGEEQVTLPQYYETIDGSNNVIAWLQSSTDVMDLILLDEILSRKNQNYNLVIPYFPYARQDRVMETNQAFSLKAFAKIINKLSYETIIILDPHSDVTPALLRSVKVIPQHDCFMYSTGLSALSRGGVLVSPDAGSYKKACNIAKLYKSPVIVAMKERDISTGGITGTKILDPDNLVKDNTVTIVDDICDGGRTFIELAKVLKAAGAKEIILYVTHGIFSQGLKPFFGLIDKIYTTTSFIKENSNQEISKVLQDPETNSIIYFKSTDINNILRTNITEE